MADARVAAAIANWAPRFVANGVDANDFERTTARIETWDEWLGAWVETGDVHREIGEEAERDGRSVTAGEAFASAAVAYHFAKFVWVVDVELNRETTLRAREMLYAAHRLLDPSAERVEIPFDGASLAGNLRGPRDAPLVLLLAGLDSTKEEFLRWEDVFLSRGLATFSLDGPGQGESGFETTIRPDYEAAVSAALDVLDWPRPVGAAGVSLGGYYAPRAAAAEPRVRAVAGVSGPYNFGECWGGLPELTRETFRHHSGAGDDDEARAAALELDLGPVIGGLVQPALMVTGRLDRLIPWEQTQRIAHEARNGRFVLFEDGNHVCNNIPYKYRPSWRTGSQGSSLVWDKFSPAEMARRYTLARELMDQHDLGALVVFGNSGVSRGNMANPFWLSNHLDLHHCYLVVPADPDEETALYTGLTNHVPNAREVTDVPIVEWGTYDPAAVVAGRLRGLGIASGRVGLVGVNATFSMGMPYAHHARLRDELPGLELVDVTGPYAGLRLVKSDEEVEWLRKGAALTDAGLLAVAEGARPGTSEIELVALGEAAYRPAGGMPRIMFLRSMAMDDPTGCLPAQNPSRRRLEAGDVVITEFSASYWGYTGQIQRPIFVGAEPAGEWRRMFDVAFDAYERIAATIGPGATEAEVIRAGSVIGEAGYAIYDDLVHGYGVDIMPPIIDRACVSHWPWDDTRETPPGRTFEEGMAVVIQPNPITPDERMGLQLGELNVVRTDGAESLHGVSFKPLIAA